MPTKRQVLDILTRQELWELVDRHHVTVTDRRSKEKIAAELDAHGPALPELLAGFSRDRLKELCRELALDDGGRDKAVIIARLAGAAWANGAPVEGEVAKAAATEPKSAQIELPLGPTPPAVPPRKAATNVTPTPVPPSPRNFQSFREITDFLWQNAERLRGVYKPNEYDKVILPLLVVRRLECVLAPTKDKVLKKLAELQGKGMKVADPIVDSVLRKTSGVPFYNTSPLDFERLTGDSQQIAQHLRSYLKAFSPNARDIIEQFKFDEQITRLDEGNLLFQVVKLFAEVNLHPDVVSNHVMGRVFEELIRRFNEKKNEEAGDHYTPREIIRLMVDLLFIEDDDVLQNPGIVRTLLDPACGTGGMLSVAEEYLFELNPQAKLEVFGQELNAETYAVCKSDMIIKGQNPDNIVRGNSFSDDGHAERKFDYMLSNPPFGVDWKNVQTKVQAEHENLGFAGRFGPGLPRINDGALLFLMHMIAKMKPVDKKTGEGGSRMAVVLNGSPLFTGDAGSGESEIRRWILENDWLEAIVALPDQLFYNTGIATYVWVITNRKPAHRKGKVQLINATELYQKMRKSLGNKRNELGAGHIKTIVDTFGDFVESEVSKVFDNEDFGYRRIIVERPLRLNFQASPERIDRLREESGFVNLAKAKKGASGEGRALQEAILRTLTHLDAAKVYKSRPAFEAALEAAVLAEGVDLVAPARKAILAALSERDETAEVCLDAKGRPEADSELRDYENVPLKEDVAVYFEREVKPHVPDAWIAGVEMRGGKALVVDEDKVKVGYEIPITRHFYKYTPPRPLEEIETDIRGLEKEILALLGEVLK
ncbi:class I SAM-dependent DNA methyltransferase [Polyangium sp. 15x6]|uniref:type I restriction-modification system subunit M n=1 Tax=Polyangium sp. 15x6 TaxID=3042687 RepID=UPI002499FAAA|nr:class I SAM-dependent DNA methyltransferase [Polyangium sp. 15x6]MDI3285043.1 class I SAM-dependent DNA methyltransferase [Polyangium sp. 15x6]